MMKAGDNNWQWTQRFGWRKLPNKCVVDNMEFSIEWTPDMPEDAEEARKQEIINAMDVTPGLAEACNGRTWREIFKLCNQEF